MMSFTAKSTFDSRSRDGFHNQMPGLHFHLLRYTVFLVRLSNINLKNLRNETKKGYKNENGVD